MIITSENLFLIFVALIWIVGAVVQDLRKREVDNIWNFSLVFVALAYRLSASVFTGNYWFFINGLIGFAVFLILGNLFYYSRLFAGGDAKLLIALGTILPLSYDWMINLKIFGIFILAFMLGGSVYSIVYSLFLIAGNFKSFNLEFRKNFRKNLKWFLVSLVISMFVAFAALIAGYSELILISLVFLLFPILLVFSKAIEEGCLVREVDVKKVTIGDWLYKPINAGGKTIHPNWEGITEKQLKLIRKNNKKITIKYGIPFTPAFLIGFIGILVLSVRGWF